MHNKKRKKRWPWMAQQSWNNVLFIHYPVSYKELRKYIPQPFTLETYEGQAWIGIILFEALHSRLRGMPKLLSFRYFLQLNIRTYVNFGGESGVYFFSLDANRQLPVKGARLVSLPYFHAQMNLEKEQETFHFKSRRNGLSNPPLIQVSYTPTSKIFISDYGSLTFWLTERYLMWTKVKNKIYKGPISHHSWSLQEAEANIKTNKYFPFESRVYKPNQPLIHYGKKMNAYVHPFEQVGLYFK